MVERSGVSITAMDIIGEGHFGNVYRGNYTLKNGDTIAVAVKACKEGVDRTTTEKFLGEACKLTDSPRVSGLTSFKLGD